MTQLLIFALGCIVGCAAMAVVAFNKNNNKDKND